MKFPVFLCEITTKEKIYLTQKDWDYLVKWQKQNSLENSEAWADWLIEEVPLELREKIIRELSRESGRKLKLSPNKLNWTSTKNLKAGFKPNTLGAMFYG